MSELICKVAFSDHYSHGSSTYDQLYICKPCSQGCSSCIDASPCIVQYNWGFRYDTTSVHCFYLVIMQSLEWSFWAFLCFVQLVALSSSFLSSSTGRLRCLRCLVQLSLALPSLDVLLCTQRFGLFI